MARTLLPLSQRRRLTQPARPGSPSPDSRSEFSLDPRLDPKTGRRSSASWQALLDTRRVRLLLTWAILVLALSGLGLRLLKLQVLEGKELAGIAKEQQSVGLSAFVPRRPVVDRAGVVLAVDESVYALFVHPSMLSKPLDESSQLLSQALNLPEAEVLKKLRSADTGVELADGISENTASQVRNLYLDGLDLIEHPQRFYPQKDLFGAIVGYVDGEGAGQAGLELSQEDQLARPGKEMRVRRMGDGGVIPTDLPAGVLHQDDLKLELTLDRRLQRATRIALDRQIKNFGAKRGTAIVMDASDGSLVAMVVSPTYDPNKFYDYDVELFRNWAVTDLYEPGSTFKPVNVAIALEAGALTPGEYIYDAGQLIISEHVVQNHDFNSAGGRGSISIPEILQVSSNIGMVGIVRKLDPGNYHGWLEKLGLGKTVATDLPSVPTSQLKTLEEFKTSPIEPATAAFGQGLSLTPLQLAQLHASLANGGKLVSPHVVKGLVDSNGEYKWKPDLPEPRQVFSQKNAQAVVEMMETVVSQGSGKTAAIPGYRIAGKTGTAQKAENGVYVAGARITSFVGIVPVEAPRYVIIAVVDEPQGEDAYGSTVAAPIVKEITQSLVSTMGIQPSQPVAIDHTGEALAVDLQGNPITADSGPSGGD